MSIPSSRLAHHFVLLSMLLVSPPQAAGAEPPPTSAPLTLQDALRELKGSPEIQRAGSAAAEASWRRVESYSGLLPSLTASASHLLGKKYALIDVALPGSEDPVSILQIIPTTSYNLSAQWTLFDGLANVARLDSARSFERAGEKNYEWTLFRARRGVILAFYRALAARTLGEVAEQNVKTLDDHLSDVRLLKSTGVGTSYDVLRVEVQASEARSELLNAEDQIEIGLMRLGELLGEDLGGRAPSGKLPILDPKLVSGLGSPDASDRPDLKALEAQVKGYDELADAASKHWIPRLAAFGQFQEYNNRNDSLTDGYGFRSAYSYGLQVSWELFNGLASHARSREAVEKRVQAEKELDQARIRAKNEVEIWRRRFLYQCALNRARTKDIGKSNETVRLARVGRAAGVRTSSDLLDAELELFRARAGALNAQIGAIEALINLELATGQELYRFE